MLFNSLGERFGLLSGGCVEQKLQTVATQCIREQVCKHVFFALDAADDDLATNSAQNKDTENRINDYAQQQDWQTAIGCGGSLKIAIIPLNQHNQYLAFEQLHATLVAGKDSQLTIEITENSPAARIKAHWSALSATVPLVTASASLDHSGSKLTINLPAPTRLLIAGAGIDAIPLANMATELGWDVAINEPRTSYRKAHLFPATSKTLAEDYSSEKMLAAMKNSHCIIIMHHNLALDGKALFAAQSSNADYIGVLGPKSRLDRILNLGNCDRAAFNGNLYGPCGIGIGGDSPSSVALSILSHCHQVISKRV